MGPQPSPPRSRGYLHTVLALFVILSLRAPSIEAQTGPRIRHDGLRCVLSGEHLILEAFVEPTDGLTTVKAYFRANLYRQFYYVEMVPAGNVYHGVLPKPRPEITGLHYYLEAMDSSFNSARTAEYTPEVVSNETSCRERNPTPAAYLDGTGAINVGSTGPGAATPSGFLSEGIAGTIPAIGRTTGGSSGLLIGGATAAGAAVGVGILVGGGDDAPANSTTTITSGATTTAATTSVPAATTTLPSASVMACFETSPSPPQIAVGGSVRFNASCTQPPREEIRSYVWDFHDGRGGREGRVVNRVYNTAGVYGAVLTVTTLAGATDTFEMDVIVDEDIAPGPGGGGGRIVRITKGGPATGTVGVDFFYNVTITNTGASDATGITMTDPLPAGVTYVDITLSAGWTTCPSLGGVVTCNAATLGPSATITATIQVTPTSAGILNNAANLTVTSPSETATARRRTTVPLRAPPGAPRRVTTRLTSHLDLPPGDGRTQAQVTFNEFSSAVTDNSGPSTHEVQGRSGENIVEGFVTRNPSGEGVWRFDFRGAPGFVPGSFTIDTGQIVSRQTHELIFRVAPGVRRIRFRFRLE